MIVINMEMPKSCFCCPFSKRGSLLDGGYYCRLQVIDGDISIYAKSQYRINGELKDKQDCPLIEIEQSEDCVSRQAVIEYLKGCDAELGHDIENEAVVEDILEMPPVTPTQRWIPVNERLPKDLEPVNITWVTHNPDYANITDKPFTATGVYFNGQWYWWSTSCTDILAEYSHNYDDVIDNDIEVIAWMPLPRPYKEKRGSDEM